MVNKGVMAAHDCIEHIESMKLSIEERNICFTSLNQYYKDTNEHEQILNDIMDKNSNTGKDGRRYCFLVGKPGGV